MESTAPEAQRAIDRAIDKLEGRLTEKLQGKLTGAGALPEAEISTVPVFKAVNLQKNVEIPAKYKNINFAQKPAKYFEFVAYAVAEAEGVADYTSNKVRITYLPDNARQDNARYYQTALCDIQKPQKGCVLPPHLLQASQIKIIKVRFNYLEIALSNIWHSAILATALSGILIPLRNK